MVSSTGEPQSTYLEVLRSMAMAFTAIALLTNNARVNSDDELLEDIIVYVPKGLEGLVLVNLGSSEREVELVCMRSDGSANIKSVNIPPESSITVNVVCRGRLAIMCEGRPVPALIVSSIDELEGER